MQVAGGKDGRILVLTCLLPRCFVVQPGLRLEPRAVGFSHSSMPAAVVWLWQQGRYHTMVACHITTATRLRSTHFWCCLAFSFPPFPRGLGVRRLAGTTGGGGGAAAVACAGWCAAALSVGNRGECTESASDANLVLASVGGGHHGLKKRGKGGVCVRGECVCECGVCGSRNKKGRSFLESGEGEIRSCCGGNGRGMSNNTKIPQCQMACCTFTHSVVHKAFDFGSVDSSNMVLMKRGHVYRRTRVGAQAL